MKRAPEPSVIELIDRATITCHIPNCINPDHLILGTQAENVADTVAAGRHGWRTKDTNR